MILFLVVFSLLLAVLFFVLFLLMNVLFERFRHFLARRNQDREQRRNLLMINPQAAISGEQEQDRLAG